MPIGTYETQNRPQPNGLSSGTFQGDVNFSRGAVDLIAAPHRQQAPAPAPNPPPTSVPAPKPPARRPRTFYSSPLIQVEQP